ncbi:MAG: hypothetical protein WC087_01930 [Candidatus Paceibacterota bacterium]
MKRLVGQREEVDPGMKGAMVLLSYFIIDVPPPPTQIMFHKTCAVCKVPIILTLTEEVETGEIWAEGPDNCSNCNHQISDPKSEHKMMSQEQIKSLFGKY